MMSITHSFVGCTLAVLVPEPVISIPLIAASHWLLDIIPHWDFGTDWKKRSVKQTGMLAIADTLIGLFVCVLLFHRLLPIPVIFFAIALANLSDWIQSIWFLFFAKKTTLSVMGKLFYLIYKFQETYTHTTDTFPHGVYTQLFTAGFFGLLMLGNG